jgi:hypothetical protein
VSFEPEKFFIGVIDLFSVLLPGALITYLFKDDLGPFFLGSDAYYQLNGASAWLAFFFSGYLLGHFVFLVGSALLDEFVYDPPQTRHPYPADTALPLASPGRWPISGRCG